MALFTRDSIDRLRDTIDMVDLVGRKTDLRRVGSRWTGLCPFHDERSPSFSVNAEEKLFYCFGCQAKGDAFGFVEQSEGLDFRESVELLADRYGVELQLENDDPQAEQRRRRRERLIKLLDRTASFYATFFWESQEAAKAREYLTGRGLGEEVLREFRVGYAPSAWDRVIVGAQRDGFGPPDLVAAGLAQRGRDGGGLYDSFRGRIMFPLADARGRVLGFGARAMGEGRGPKYLNTSENDVYHKGRQLFGIHLARAHAAKSGRIVVVEGYTDVLAMHQAGMRDSVAIMGTALTAEQMAVLSQAAPVVLLALDADRSGQEAMLRAARLAQDRGVELRAVEMPEGTDPADILAAGGSEGFVKRLDEALAMIQFQVRRVLADADLGTPTGRDKALEEARSLLAATPEGTPMHRELVREIADRLDLPADSPWLTAPAPKPAVRFGRPVEAAGPTLPAGASAGEAALRAEREFLVRCLASGDLGREYLSRPTDDQLSSDPTRRARTHLVAHFEDPLAALSEDDAALGALVTDVALAAQEQPASPEAVLRMSILQLEKRRIEREIRRAAQAGDHARQSELAAAEQRVRGELDEVMGQTA
jgi:DNA primase